MKQQVALVSPQTRQNMSRDQAESYARLKYVAPRFVFSRQLFDPVAQPVDDFSGRKIIERTGVGEMPVTFSVTGFGSGTPTDLRDFRPVQIFQLMNSTEYRVQRPIESRIMLAGRKVEVADNLVDRIEIGFSRNWLIHMKSGNIRSAASAGGQCDLSGVMKLNNSAIA